MRGKKPKIACVPGQRFGKLVVVRKFTKYTSGDKPCSACICKCDCGKDCEVWSSQLRYENKDSCGCVPKRGQRHQCPPGERYGMLTILSTHSKEVWNRKYKFAICRCDCGNEVELKTSYLRNGHTSSCGCLLRRSGHMSPNFKGHGEIGKSVWANIIEGSKRRSRDIPFEITIEQAWDLFEAQNRGCAISGVPIDFGERIGRRSGQTKRSRSASLDRIDSSKGYTIDNVQWIHKDLQFMKGSMSDGKFIQWCKTIANYNA